LLSGESFSEIFALTTSTNELFFKENLATGGRVEYLFGAEVVVKNDA
jgi:hypothetical protein